MMMIEIRISYRPELGQRVFRCERETKENLSEKHHKKAKNHRNEPAEDEEK